MEDRCLEEEQCKKLIDCECYSSAVEMALTKICNEFMEVDENGKFINHRFSEEVNMLLGIV